MYAADTASRHLGITLDEVAPGRAVARMRVTEEMIQGHGTCHGGYIFLLADSAFAFACNSHGPTAVAAACDIVFVSPVRIGDELVAVAEERVLFGRSGVYDVTVRRADGDVVAEFRGRSRVVPTRK
jgi:acyl-CoA thioesterase